MCVRGCWTSVRPYITCRPINAGMCWVGSGWGRIRISTLACKPSYSRNWIIENTSTCYVYIVRRININAFALYSCVVWGTNQCEEKHIRFLRAKMYCVNYIWNWSDRKHTVERLGHSQCYQSWWFVWTLSQILGGFESQWTIEDRIRIFLISYIFY